MHATVVHNLPFFLPAGAACTPLSVSRKSARAEEGGGGGGRDREGKGEAEGGRGRGIGDQSMMLCAKVKVISPLRIGSVSLLIDSSRYIYFEVYIHACGISLVLVGVFLGTR